MAKIEDYIQQISQKTWLNSIVDKPQQVSVSVVVPVFNGYQALKKCVRALLVHTSHSIPLIFLDDASSDQRVSQFLAKIAEKHQHVRVITQPKNKGYLKNVNSYLQHSEGDVLLLNADTEVTAGWLTEMLLVAADKRVGAVCPLSDNATLLSISATDSSQIARLQQFSQQWYSIPTTVGFCMLIKQQVLKSLGGFDLYYDPGYGEECDYSMRIRNMGLQLACAPAAFVYHQGSQSFQNQSKRLQPLHQKLLDLRWPSYSKEIAQFQSRNPARFVEVAIQLEARYKGKILHVLHGIDNKGGVELFTHELLNRFDADFHHTVLIPKRDKKFKASKQMFAFEIIELEALTHQPEQVMFNLPADLYHSEYDLYFQNMVLAGNFDLVHFHSLIGVGTQVWPLICQQLGVSYQLFVHDHFGLCQIYSLSTKKNQREIYCGKKAMQTGSLQCIRCLTQKTQKGKLTTESFMSLRKEIWMKIMAGANQLYFPSEYLQDIYVKQHKSITNKSTVIKPCFYPAKTTTTCKDFVKDDIHIAFLGQFGELKGAQLFIDFYIAVNRPGITYHIMGGIDPIYQEQLNQTDIVTHGQYESHQLPQLLENIDLVVFTSVIPETYGITLTEAWLYGKPVLAPRLGVYVERVNEGLNGHLYEFNDLNSLTGCFENWLETQYSNQGLKQIQNNETAEDGVELIQRNYKHVVSQHKTAIRQSQGTTINRPGVPAWEYMERWLQSPNTLEAEGDWRTPPENLVVVILGEDEAAIKLTEHNLQDQLNHPQIFNITSEQMFAEDMLLLLTAGSLINENAGNWIATFKQQQAKISTADHALHNMNLQQYAAQFQNRFSWQNHQLARPFSAGILLKPDQFSKERIKQLLSLPTLNEMIEAVYQDEASAVTHFPYHCYSMADYAWAKQWKQNVLGCLEKQRLTKKSKVLILLETNAQNKKCEQSLLKQSVFKQSSTSLEVFSSEERVSLLNQAEKQSLMNHDHVVWLRDNVFFKDITTLETAIRQLAESALTALSPVTTNSVVQGAVAGKKWGASNHFVGIGRVRDSRFDLPDTAFEYDLLDDDIIIFKSAAFKAVLSTFKEACSYYGALNLSKSLRQRQLSFGLTYTGGLYKQGMPSPAKNSDDAGLYAQRQNLIEREEHVPKQPIYSSAFSCRNQCNLDLQITSFKTPKIMPRIMGYAHDESASGFYRVRTPLAALAAANQASIHFLPVANKHHTATPYELMRQRPDALLLHHYFSDPQLAALIQYRKQANLRIVLGIDDLLTEIPQYNRFSQTVPSDIATRIKLVCSMVDCLVVSSEPLAEAFSSYIKSIVVIPNSLSESIWSFPGKLHKENHRLRIGWAGAGQHQDDLSWLKPVIDATHGDCQWVFFGDMPSGVNPKLVEFHPPVPLQHYPKKLASLNLDLAIAPLVDVPFNQAKSNLKLLEYGVLGIPVIASDLSPYQNSPAQLLGNRPAEWIAAIEEYQKNRHRLEQQGEALKRWVMKNHILEQQLDDWIKVLL